MSERAGRYQRSVSGLIGALLVLLLVIAVVVVLRAVTSRNPPSPVQTVHFRQDVPYARKAAHFDLLAPASLPAGWRATTVNFTPEPRQEWHLGVLTDQGRYVGLEQANRPVGEMVKDFVDASAVRGRPVTVDGARWLTYTDSGGDVALVRRAGRTTTLVVGHEVPRVELTGYIRSLR